MEKTMASGDGAMQWLNEMLESVEVGEPVSSGLLTMVPLLGEASAAPPYLTLDEALEAKQLKVTELDEGASVPELLLLNEGELDVFLLDGEELVGAKQNRVLNLSVLARAKSRRAPNPRSHHKEIPRPVAQLTRKMMATNPKRRCATTASPLAAGTFRWLIGRWRKKTASTPPC